MKNPLILTAALLAAACSPAQSRSSLKADASAPTLLGLNDVSILLPFNEVKDLETKGLDFRTKPDPETFAKGQTALPLDDQSFVPGWILGEIQNELKEDEDLRQTEWDSVSNLDERTPDQDELLGVLNGDPGQEVPALNPLPAENTFLLTSVRFDPCANGLAAKSPADCTQEMRFVWTEHSQFGLRDSNIHAIYELTHDQFQDIVSSLRTMVAESGMDTTKLPLQVQPVVIKQGLEGNYYQGLIAIIHRYARSSNLKHIAFLKDTMGGLQGHWPMLKFELNGGTAKHELIVNEKVLQGETPKFVQRINGEGASLSQPSPMAVIADTIFPEAKLGLQRNDKTTVKAKIENTFRVENPRLHGTGDLDCSSCHQAQTERKLVDKKATATSAKAYKSSNWNLALTTTIPDDTALQIFSFFNSSPRIAPRAVNESAEAADMIRDRF